MCEYTYYVISVFGNLSIIIIIDENRHDFSNFFNKRSIFVAVWIKIVV